MEVLNSSEIKLLRKIGKVIMWITSLVGPIGIIFFLLMSIVVGIASNQNNNTGGTIPNLTGKVPAEFIEDFNYAAEVSGIPNWVLAAVSKHESSFRMEVVSDAGAYGLMQFRKLENDGSSNWEYYLGKGLDNWLKEAGFTYSSSEEAWSQFLSSSRIQILAGAFSLMEKGNYALVAENVLDVVDPFNKENMQLFPWTAPNDDPQLRNTLRRMFVVYNYGQGAGMTVDLDNAHSNYPNRVYDTAMEFREGGLEDTIVDAEGVVGQAIAIGKSYIGKSKYVFGGGRTESDIKNGIFDCSSFVHHIYKQAGLELGPVTSATTYTLINKGQKVAFDDMIPGDLIFFNAEGEYNSHMGVYIGNNSFIHCAINRGVVIAEFNSYWRPVFLQATRVVN